jgi:hypothetical protein
LRSLKGRDHLEDPGVDKRIILKSILEKQEWRAWIEFIWLMMNLWVTERAWHL